MPQNPLSVIFPDWKIVQKIGEGSFGGVYEISRVLPDGKVEYAALKKLSVPRDREEIDILQAQSFSKASITAYFKQQMQELVNEYAFMQELGECPTVVSCQDIRYIQHDDEIGWDIYIRMELLHPLKKEISKKYSEYQVLRLGMDICRALLACEGLNIIHRDIKPENILVSDNGRYKLGDFGIAKVSEKTETGTLAGTNGYMAPEVANRQHYSREVDIYSLGLVLYWMMNNNTLPFLPMPPKIPSAEKRQEAVSRRLDGEALPPPHNGSDDLKRVVLKACAFKPEDRYHSAREFGAALQRIFRNLKATDADGILQEIGMSTEMLNGEPGSTSVRAEKGRVSTERGESAAEQKEFPKRKRKGILLGIVPLALLLVGISVFFMRQPKNKQSMQIQPETSDSSAIAQNENLEVSTTETTETKPSSPYLYDLCDGGIRILGWKEELPSEIILPDSIDGLAVAEIGAEAFRNCSSVTAIRIPESVHSIGEYAFAGCTGLKRIELPLGLDTLEDGLFSNCPALTQIILPDSVKIIGKSVFENCAELENIDLPQSVTVLGERSFSDCSKLNDILLPDNLEEIGQEAFKNCMRLSGIDIPESVMQIGDSAFYDSLMLTATIPGSFINDTIRFLPESCEVTYSNLEKPVISGEIGDIISFGSYEQDNDLANGSEPIEWQILEKDGSKLTLISKYGLDSQKYHDKWEIVCWETCKLRVWLNQTFYTTAFNPVEQSMIVTTDIRSVHPSGAYPSRTVQDKVFLLDYNGAYGYFKSEKSRTCIATAYADAQGSAVEYGGRCWWWLREGYFVDLGSIPNTKRDGLTDSGGTVRPMICIELS